MSQETDPNQGPKPGTPEYDQEMAKRGRGENMPASDDEGTQDKPPVPDMPEGGQEKFYNKETGEYDWANHAKDLQYRLDQAKGKNGKDDPNANEDPAEGGEDPAEKAVTSLGLDPTELVQQITTTGAISDEARQKLIEAGYDEALIDSYTELAKSHVEASAQDALEYVGGEQGWNQVKTWADQNLSEEEKVRYNQALGGEDWRQAVDALRFRMGQSKPTAREGSLDLGDAPTNTSPSGYRSRAEMKRDMADPKYTSDPAFRQQVMQKMRFATWDLDAQDA